MIVAIGTGQQAYFEFSYSTMQTDFWAQAAFVAFASVLCLSCAITFFIQFILAKTTQTKISKAVNKVKDSALVMSIEMNKAKFAHAEYQKILQEEKKVQDAKAQDEWN